MQVVRDSNEAEMVWCFLAAEVDSPRFSSYARATLALSLTENPDFSNRTENVLRKAALDRYRGERELFAGFPRVVDWKMVRSTIRELGGFRYLRLPLPSPWNTLSEGSLLVHDGAANAYLIPAEENANANILGVELRVRSGEVFPPMVAVAEGEEQPHYLLEGHTRATAYVRVKAPDDEVELVVGYVSDLTGWRSGPKP